MATFNIQGRVLDKHSKLAVPFANVLVYEVDKVGNNFKSDLIAQKLTDLDGSINITFTWSYDISIPSNRPDIIFKVTQNIDGTDKTIYNENPATETRYNIGDYLSVTLEAEGGASINPTPTGRPYDKLFVFTRVGIIGVNEIDTVGAAASGYAYPDTDPSAPNSRAANTPFGRTLDIAGWFGQFTNLSRYKLQYSSDGVTFTDISDPLSNSYYEFAATGGHWITQAMGPVSEGGQSNMYKLPYLEKPGQPWIFPDLIAKWDTTKMTDGLYTLRIKGYKWSGASLVPVSEPIDLLIDPSYGVLKLLLDNSPPTSKINEIKHGGATVQVCDIVDFSTGTLSVTFEASDTKGHLREYVLNAMYGHNKLVSPLPSGAADNYSMHIAPSRHWTGGNVTVNYDGSVYTNSLMPTCAYQFRLDVTKRTTNGYGLIYHDVEDTYHITLKRP